MRVWIWPAVLLLAGCDSRTVSVPVPDGAAADGRTDRMVWDAPAYPEASAPPCALLVAQGATELGPKTATNARPAVVHDGTHFGVAWLHGQKFTYGTPASTASLLFARVDAAGKAVNAAGAKLGVATSDVLPALTFGGGEYAVLFKTPSPATTPAVTVLQRFRPTGSATGKATVVAGETRGVALAPSPGGGQAALLAEKGKPGDTLVFVGHDAKGVWTRRTVHSGGSYWLPWIGRGASGYAAAWQGGFARLSPGGAPQQVTTGGGGISPAYSVSASGYAVAYIRSHGSPPTDNVEFQRLGAGGTADGKARVVGGNASYGALIASYVSLVWTGGMHVVVYERYSSTSSALVAQLVDAKGGTVGGPVTVPLCTPKAVVVDLAAAFGGDTLAVVTRGAHPGAEGVRLCVSRMRCMP